MPAPPTPRCGNGGRGPCLPRLWREADQLICSATDTGHTADPLAGRAPPLDAEHGGLGLLLVHQLADLVRIHTTPTGTTVRAYLPIPTSTSNGAGPPRH